MALYDAYEAYVNLDSSALKDAGVDCSDDDDDDDDLLLLVCVSFTWMSVVAMVG